MLDLSRVEFHSFMAGADLYLVVEYDLQTEEREFLVGKVCLAAWERDRCGGNILKQAKMYTRAHMDALGFLEAQLAKEEPDAG